MRKTLLALAAVAGMLGAQSALAGKQCYWLGSQWICNYDGGGSTQCYWLGKQWICN